MEDNIKNVIKITDNEISKTFCFAKWYHTTIYLQTGETHSCYHPAPHKILPSELLRNPSALHNTSQKKLERKEMLDGKQCNGCNYCWNIENMGKDFISDRHIRSSSIYTEERLAEVKNNQWDFDVNPQYIEISFGNECNFKCGYCHPRASSRYYQEIQQHGPYNSVLSHRNDIDWFKIYTEDSNLYLDAWWKWWPEVSKTLDILRITGGEPTIQKSTYKLFDELDKSPKPQLELNVNSNLGAKHSQIVAFTNRVNDLLSNKKIAQFKLFTSIDTWGKRAEYIRHGLDLELFEKNLDYFLTNTTAPITFMITFSNLSVTTFQLLLEKILEWRKKYNNVNTYRWQRIHFDTPYLKEPLLYDINILPKDQYMSYMDSHLNFIKSNVDNTSKIAFNNLEYEKFRRVVEYMRKTQYDESKLAIGRRDFYNFFTEHDRRRGTDFLSTFPEMEEFMNLCFKENTRKV